MIEIKCYFCGKTVIAKSHKRKFCNSLCGNRYRSSRNPKNLECFWCGEKITVYKKRGWDKILFCSSNCREEFHSFNDKRSPFYNMDKNKEEVLKSPDNYVRCEICGKLSRRRLSTHVRKKHNLSWKQYLSIYPNAKNECEEVRKFVYAKERYKTGLQNGCFKNGWTTITRLRKEQVGYRCEICGFDKYKESLF